MKHKVAELEGALLDAAVALCEGDFDPHRPRHEFQMLLKDGRRVLAGVQGHATKQHEWSPSTDWAIGGPIIEREQITIQPWPEDWAALWYGPHGAAIGAVARGPTPLIAAMRAYVASRFGDEIDLPEITP